MATGEEAAAQVGMSPMSDTPLSLTPEEAEADTDEEINITPPHQPLKTVYDLGTNKPAPSEDLVTHDEEEAEEGEKGGGMFTALAGDEVGISAIKETATMIRSGELSDAVQLDEDDDEDETFKGQFRFLKLT
ncbi:hypothetical protein CYMTET_51719 [Cymbomonas tetramitiformis]|uniref:Uncharacterized protein n=1 Tax=Cymbomonas tetramitiformis TaxID=36881 RepID=A0AAE0ESD4_9CHLO|nr:hypothetical protein CYMTET_51719 [Cymbomonas tetramitiformis]